MLSSFTASSPRIYFDCGLEPYHNADPSLRTEDERSARFFNFQILLRKKISNTNFVRLQYDYRPPLFVRRERIVMY